MTYSLADFVTFCTTLRTENGKPLRIQPFQRTFLADYFDGVPETVIVLPSGNGKTTLLGALAIYHMLRVPNAEVLIAASAADQAETLFKQAGTLILETPHAEKLDVKTGVRVIYHKGPGPNRRPPGRIRVLSADVNANDGAIPTLALVDELHRHKDGEMYGMFRDRLPKRGGQMLTISTAGARLDSALGLLRERAHELPGFMRRGTYNHVRTGPFAWHEHCLEPEDDPDDLRLVKKANPAKWVTLKALKQRHDSPTMTRGQWSRYACGLWTASEEPAIDPKLWDALAGDIGHVEEGEDVIMAAHVGETAWIAIVAQRDEGRVAAKVLSLGEDRSGVKVEARLLELAERYNVQQVTHPRTTFMRSAEILEAAGLPMEETPYSPQRFGVISATFNRLLNAGLLMHDGDPVLRAQVLAATSKETETGWRYVLSPRSAALITLANACHQATAFSPEPVIILPSGGVG